MNRAPSNGGAKRKPVPDRLPITIRLPEKIVRQIDQDLSRREVPLSRNNWLLEAALEKLRKPDAGGANGAK